MAHPRRKNYFLNYADLLIASNLSIFVKHLLHALKIQNAPVDKRIFFHSPGSESKTDLRKMRRSRSDTNQISGLVDSVKFNRRKIENLNRDMIDEYPLQRDSEKNTGTRAGFKRFPERVELKKMSNRSLGEFKHKKINSNFDKLQRERSMNLNARKKGNVELEGLTGGVDTFPKFLFVNKNLIGLVLYIGRR